MSARSRSVAVIAVWAITALACSSGPTTTEGSPSGSAPSTPSATAPLTGEVTFFAYEDAFADELLDPFRTTNPGLEVRTAAFSSGDEAIAKLRGGFQADVINVCIEDTPRMVRMGLLQPIDVSRISNWERMFPAFKEMPGVQVDGQVYVVPMVGGTTGVIYDGTDVPDGVASYADMFDGRFAGRLTLGNDALTGIATAALAMGYEDPLNLSDDDLAKVRDFLIDHKPQIRTFFAGDADVINLFKNDEVDVAAPGYPGVAFLLRKDGEDVRFASPEEGQLTWVCGYGIGANAQNVDAAYALINHYSEPAQQAYQAINFSYLVSNQDTLAEVPAKIVDRVGLEAPEQLTQAIPYVFPDNYDAWLNAWREFKAA